LESNVRKEVVKSWPSAAKDATYHFFGEAKDEVKPQLQG
jgi:hypothetical protein